MKKIIVLAIAILTLSGCSTDSTDNHSYSEKENLTPTHTTVTTTSTTTQQTITTTSLDDYIANCEVIEYNELSENPNLYKGRNVAYFAKVLQFYPIGRDGNPILRVALSTSNSFDYNDVALVTFPEIEAQFLAGDYIFICGECKGEDSYTESSTWEEFTVPLIEMKYYQEEDSFSFSPQEYMENCTYLPYNDLATNPDIWIGTDLAYMAKVVQVISPEYGNEYTYRLAVSDSFSFNSNDIIIATYTPEDNYRPIENDVLAILGKAEGTMSYESILGQKITLPYIDIKYAAKADTSMLVTTDENGNQSFEFEGLKISISPEYTFTTIENKFSDYFENPVIAVPVTITNVSEETKYLYSGDVELFNPAGISLDSIHYLMDDGDDLFKDLRSGATQESYLYVLYDGDGDYYFEFQDFDYAIEIKYPVVFR